MKINLIKKFNMRVFTSATICSKSAIVSFGENLADS